MNNLKLTLLLSLLLLSCTQVNDVPQDGSILPVVRYNYNSDSTVYDSAWLEYEDTLLIIESVSSVDTFYLKSHLEERYVYGTDSLIKTQVFDTVIRSYNQGFIYEYVTAGDTLSEIERFPPLSSSSSSSNIESSTAQSSSNQISSAISTTSSSIVDSSVLESSTTTISSSSSIEQSSTESSSSIDDLRYIKIDVISKSIIRPAHIDGSSYKLYLHILYDGAGTEIDVDLDNLILRYQEDYAEVNGVKFDSLTFATQDTVLYNSNTKEITLGLNDTAKIQMYYPVDTTKTVMKIAFSNYDNYFYGIVDSVAYQQYLDTLSQ